jgi:hypothetical protein
MKFEAYFDGTLNIEADTIEEAYEKYELFIGYIEKNMNLEYNYSITNLNIEFINMIKDDYSNNRNKQVVKMKDDMNCSEKVCNKKAEYIDIKNKKNYCFNCYLMNIKKSLFEFIDVYEIIRKIQRLLWLVSEPLICEAADDNGWCDIWGCGDCVINPGKYYSEHGGLSR